MALISSRTTKISGTAGQALSQYAFVYCVPETGFYRLADQTSETTADCIGIVTQSNGIPQDTIGLIQITPGLVSNSAWSLNEGQNVYLGASGGLTQTMPVTGIVKPLGFAVTETQILFKPDTGWEAERTNESVLLTYLDDDTTLSDNSTEKIPTQHAVKTYVDNHVGGNSGTSIITGTAGEVGGLARYDVVYASAGKFYKGQCDGTEAQSDVVGIVYESGGMALDAPGEILLTGTITNSSWTWTAGSQLYLSGTLGTLTHTEPSTVGQYVKPCGFAVSATEIYFSPMNGWLVGVGEAVEIHASEHLSGSDDEIDGDKIDIDYVPSNYTSAVASGYSTTTGHLSSHLKGIDDNVVTVIDNYNIISGAYSGQSLNGGSYNIFLGDSSGHSSITGFCNLNFGHQSGYSNVTGRDNLNLGYQSGLFSTSSNNIFIGSASGRNSQDIEEILPVGSSRSTSCSEGTLIAPFGYAQNLCWYRCLNTGTTASLVLCPTYPSNLANISIGDTIVDGDITLKAEPSVTPNDLAEYWFSDTYYPAGSIVAPHFSSNFLYSNAVAGTSGSSTPTFNATIGGTTTDGTVTWVTCHKKITSILQTWVNGTFYNVGDMVKLSSPNGYWYRCITAGTSTVSPSSTTDLETTTIGGVTWLTYKSIHVRQATAEYDVGDIVCLSTAQGASGQNPSSYLPDKWYRCSVAGTSGSSTPTFNATIGGTTTDGTVTWVTLPLSDVRFLYHKTSPVYNVCLGTYSGYECQSNSNTFIGYKSGYQTKASRFWNSDVGGLWDYQCEGNVNIGLYSGEQTVNGTMNVYLGYEAGQNGVNANNNIMIGWRAGWINRSGSCNVYIGQLAGYLGQGNFNTVMGWQAGQFLGRGSHNTFLGNLSAGNAGDTYSGSTTGVKGNYNTCSGSLSGFDLTTGESNCFYGYWSGGGKNQFAGNCNCFFGNYSGYGYNNGTPVSEITSNYNCCFGDHSGYNLIDGYANIYIGTEAGYSSISNYSNVGIGHQALKFNTLYNNVTAIGNGVTATASNQVILGTAGQDVYGGTYHTTSDERDKNDIRDTELGLSFINNLRPRDFKWNYRSLYRSDPPTDPRNESTEEEKASYLKEVDSWVEDNKLSNIFNDGSKTKVRFHHGLIAQEVKSVMDTLGVDFGGYQDHSICGGDDALSIAYTEFIGPLIKAVQELSFRLDNVEKANGVISGD